MLVIVIVYLMTVMMHEGNMMNERKREKANKYFLPKISPRHHMGQIVLDGYFPQKLSLFFQLQQLFLSTFGVESPASFDISGQSCRQGSAKLIFGPTTS